MNRREFFVKSAKAVIPITGAALLIANPAIAKVLEQAGDGSKLPQELYPIPSMASMNAYRPILWPATTSDYRHLLVIRVAKRLSWLHASMQNNEDIVWPSGHWLMVRN